MEGHQQFLTQLSGESQKILQLLGFFFFFFNQSSGVSAEGQLLLNDDTQKHESSQTEYLTKLEHLLNLG